MSFLKALSKSTKASKSGHLGVDQTRGPAAARRRAHYPGRRRRLLVHRWGCRSAQTCVFGCLVGLSKRAHLAFLEAKNSTTRGRTGTSPPPPGPASDALQLLRGASGAARHTKKRPPKTLFYFAPARNKPTARAHRGRRRPHGLARVLAGTGLNRQGGRGLRPGSASCAQGGLK